MSFTGCKTYAVLGTSIVQFVFVHLLSLEENVYYFNLPHDLDVN